MKYPRTSADPPQSCIGGGIGERALRQGITTVSAFPYDRNIIGGMGAVLKTGGEKRLEARLVKDAAFLRGAMGSLPSSGNRPSGSRPANFYARRPTTRMGVEWEWRKAFYDRQRLVEL